jgi:hypothetical protein
MHQTRFIAQPDSFGALATVLAVGVGLVGLFGAGRALTELLYILECSGAIGGTRAAA